MTHYGLFANLIGTVSSLTAAAAAVSLAFTKRTQWQPPEEAVPQAVARLAALLTIVGLALLYVFAARLGTVWLAVVMVAGLACALWSLMIAMKTNMNYAFYHPAEKVEKNRRLGGDQLTDEAAAIAKDKKLTVQQMFEDAQGDKDLIWTRQSQFAVNRRSTLSFIFLIGAGGCCIAAAGMLVATADTPAARPAASVSVAR